MIPKNQFKVISKEYFFKSLADNLNTVNFRCIRKNIKKGENNEKDKYLKPDIRIIEGIRPGVYETLSSLASRGYDIYFNVNMMDGFGYLEENLAGVRAFYIDIDKYDREFVDFGYIAGMIGGIEPDFVVNTNKKEGKYHFYYIVKGDLANNIDECRNVQRWLVETINSGPLGIVADPGIKDLTRILRAPGFKRKRLGLGEINVYENKHRVDRGDRRNSGNRLFDYYNTLASKGGATSGGTGRNLVARPHTSVDAGNYRDLVDYLKVSPVAIEGEGGDNFTFNFIMQLRARWSVDDEVLLGLLEEYWNPRCEPPWSSGELAEKIRNVARYSSIDAGFHDSEQVRAIENEGGGVNADIAWVNKTYEVVGSGLSDGGIDKLSFERAAREFIPSAFLKERCVDVSASSLSQIVSGLGFNLSYNIMDNIAEFNGYVPWGEKLGRSVSRRLNDNTAHEVKIYIQQWCRSKNWEYGSIRDSELTLCLMNKALGNSFNPVVEELDRLVWDGIDRLSDIGSRYFGVAGGEFNGLQNEYIKRWMLGAICRIYQPGTKFDNMLVLVGKQGCGKSSSMRFLFGDEYYTDSLRGFSSKDDMLTVSGSWIIEIAELSAMNKGTNEEIKKFLSSVSDKFRVPYGKEDQVFPRKAVLYGTTNSSIFLNDATGNRRYWPVHVGEIDLKGLLRDRENILAQMVGMYKSEGVGICALDRDLWKMSMEWSGKFEDSTWRDAIEDFLANKHEMESVKILGSERSYFTNADVRAAVLSGSGKHYSMQSIKQMIEGVVNASGGWTYQRVRGGADNNQFRAWVEIKNGDSDEI